jgi:putative sigma-54 modulation protein
MQVGVTFRHVGPSDALREQAQRKVSRLARVAGEAAIARVVLAAERGRHRAEVSLAAPGLAVMAAQETDDVHGALDRVVDALERQVRDARERRREPRRQPPADAGA